MSLVKHKHTWILTKSVRSFAVKVEVRNVKECEDKLKELLNKPMFRRL